MTIDASTYFRPCDCTGGNIEVDTTIYIAPSAAAQSPTGVVGSDLTGDGSLQRPFFSIKRAMEFLTNYSIKPGVYVTIRGLSGKYYYNDNHAVDIRHKDSKFIKIEFDMLEPNLYHVTTITTDAVTVTNNTDHDLVTFTVDNAGDIQAGEYIKIVTDNSIINDYTKAVWNGYFRVDSVNGNQITIIYKREQINGLYNTNHSYGFPATLVSGDVVNVIKFSSHVYITYTNTPDYFIYSEFGLGGLKINVSDETYYNSGPRSIGFVAVYDGVLNGITYNINGFSTGAYFENLKINYDVDTNLYLRPCITSCNTSISFVQSKIKLIGHVTANCGSGFQMTNSNCYNIDNTIRILGYNTYYHGFTVSTNSKFNSSGTVSSTNIINSFYNQNGISCWFSSAISGTGYNLRYNYNGLNIYNSSVQFYSAFDSNTTLSKIFHNNIGIYSSAGTIDLSYTDISYNDTYGVQAENNANVINLSTSANSVYIWYSGNVGLMLTSSRADLNNASIRYSTNDGVYLDTSIAKFDVCTINNNGRYGIRLYRLGRVSLKASNVNSNSSRGIYGLHNSDVYIDDTYVTGNTTYNIQMGYNSNCCIYNPSAKAVSNTVPTKNVAPAYGSGNGGSYIIETTY